MTVPAGFSRVWHSSKFWTAVVAWLTSTGTAAAPLLLSHWGLVPLDAAGVAAAATALYKVASAGALGLGGIVISLSGLEDAARKNGITDPIPLQPHQVITAPAPAAPPAGK